MASPQLSAYRSAVAHLLGDPAVMGDKALEYFEDGLLLIEDGIVKAVGSYDSLKDQLPEGLPVTRFDNALITPGLVDIHVHYPQVDVIGSYGAQLMDWLENYTFPSELAFADRAHTDFMADFFLQELLRNGTTAAMVFATIHKSSVEAIFDAALARNMRIISGKVLMDRGAPAGLLDGEDLGRADSEALIEDWQGKGRLGYALTPRFAPTSTCTSSVWLEP